MKKYLLFVLALFTMVIQAQSPGDIAQSFGTDIGIRGFIYTIEVKNNDKILIGNVLTYKGKKINGIICLNQDGSEDTSINFGYGFNNTVYKILVQPDGKILVGGDFTSYNNVSVNGIIRLNPDGSIDTSFNSGTGFLNGLVKTIALQPDGKILVGGNFNSYNGVNEKYIIRLNSDGSKDTSFNIGTGFNSKVNTIFLQNNGKILVGGTFSSFNGENQKRITRLNSNGSRDITFIAANAFSSINNVNNWVNVILQQADGKILVGGWFGFFNGNTVNHIVRLNEDGTKDNNFNSGSGFSSSFNSLICNVFSIESQPDGKILIGGDFTSYNGISGNQIIRINPDGTRDATFDTGNTFLSGGIHAIKLHSIGKILAGGNPFFKPGVSERGFIILNGNGTRNTNFDSGNGFYGPVRAIVQQPDGKLILGGEFSTYNKQAEKYITRLNLDGSKDNSFNIGATGFNKSVSTICLQTDGKVLVGGAFTSCNELNENRIIRLNADGTKDITFNTGTGFNINQVNTILQQPDGKILVGGSFTSYNNLIENNIIRLNLDGTKDTSFNTGTGFNSRVYSIKLQTNGKILVGGHFSSYNGVPENKIIRLNVDGTKDTSFNTGTGFEFNGSIVESVITSIELQADGKILVGGRFTNYNGIIENNNIIRLNNDGTKDLSFNTGTGFNEPHFGVIIKQLSNEKILIYGGFTTYNGLNENYIICLNPDGGKDTSFNTGTGFDKHYEISDIKEISNGKILIGGNFNIYKDSVESPFLIGLHSETSILNEPLVPIIFPNPVSNELNIHTNKNINSVKIYDLKGNLIKEGTEKIINVIDFSEGLYVLKIETNDGVYTKKFIKE